MTTQEIQTLAEKHLGANPNGSDRFCLKQSKLTKFEATAKAWAIKSLAHSVGVFHPDYEEAAKGTPYA